MKFEVKNDFLIDGKPYKIISGAVHYFRIAPSKWYQSLYNLKAMGANTVETYIPWNFHEPEEGKFTFSGWADIEEFLKEATELGLYIILRPSPYICAEWEYGGYPAWLLQKKVRIRSCDDDYFNYLDKYYSELMPHLTPYQFTCGGNVLMMQIENEYGSYGNDKIYLKRNRALMEKYGVDVPLFTSDGGWEAALEAGTLIDEQVLPTVNFGSNAEKNFLSLKQFMAAHHYEGPLMCMEFWDGWFNQWGKDVILRDPEETAQEMRAILKQGSINMYMFHGGTNFGFMNGANESLDEGYEPQVTSYDYDAPLNEQGNPTEKFFAFQRVIKEQVPEAEFSEPILSAAKVYPSVTQIGKVDLFSTIDKLVAPTISRVPMTMEELNQNYGYVLYETEEPLKGVSENFQIVEANDRAQVYFDDEWTATRTRKDMEQPFETSSSVEGKKLRVLMENTGRTNYGPYLTSQRQEKGIKGGVRQNIHFLSGWKQYPLDFQHIETIDYSYGWKEGLPSFYHFELEITGMPAETFIDLADCGKGILFVNGFNVGRFWEKGPYTTLFIPADLLKEGSNEIVVFETEGKNVEELHFCDQAQLKKEVAVSHV